MTPAVLTRWSPAPTLLPSIPVDEWPIVELAGERWRVAPVPWAPIAIGDAPVVAEAYGCELPTRDLVDAIAKVADFHVEPTILTNTTEKLTINCQRHAWIVAGQLAGVERDQLVVGTHKDVIRTPQGLALYGWHRRNGTVWQPVFRGHSASFLDYSQGLRLVRKA